MSKALAKVRSVDVAVLRKTSDEIENDIYQTDLSKRRAIYLDALLDLLESGRCDPSAKEIARQCMEKKGMPLLDFMVDDVRKTLPALRKHLSSQGRDACLLSEVYYDYVRNRAKLAAVANDGQQYTVERLLDSCVRFGNKRAAGILIADAHVAADPHGLFARYLSGQHKSAGGCIRSVIGRTTHALEMGSLNQDDARALYNDLHKLVSMPMSEFVHLLAHIPPLVEE